MSKIKHVLRFLSSIFLGAFLTTLAAFLFLTILGIPEYGIWSFMMPLYFWVYIVSCTVPLGAFLGITEILFHKDTRKEKAKHKVEPLMVGTKS